MWKDFLWKRFYKKFGEIACLNISHFSTPDVDKKSLVPSSKNPVFHKVFLPTAIAT